MSAYDHLPTSNYNLHSSTPDHPINDLSAQQQLHAHALPAAQPYHFDPQQHEQQQAYNGQASSHAGDQQQPLGGAGGVEKPRWKGNRLRKACDSCSIRKVRCDESGPPCLACSALDIPCTFQRPSRRRGPPNRHAEAVKRQRVDSPPASTGFSVPVSPNNVAATLASFSSHAVLSAESICPFPIVELLVNDFFTYIHPLVPFPHEPSFRAAFSQREDLNNPSFLALLAALVGALVASFPRRPRLHLKNHNQENLFPTSMSLVDRCHKIAVEARGPGYLDKDLTVYDAATSYFLALIGAYTIDYRKSRLYFGETLTILRVTGAHRIKDLEDSVAVHVSAIEDDTSRYGNKPGEPLDFIRQEIGRRIFWTVFVGARSLQQVGASFSELIILPPTPSEPFPPYPLEVDDQHIYVDHIDPQPTGVISEITGFNLGCQIYMSCTALATMDMAYGIDEIFDWNKQKRALEDGLRAVKRVLDNAPKELLLTPSLILDEFNSKSDRAYLVQADGLRGHPTDGVQHSRLGLHDDARRHLQYEIQKANIYASQLGTRSYIVEKYWNLLEAYESRMKGRDSSSKSPSTQGSPGGVTGTPGYDIVEGRMSAERETIVKDLLKVLGSISQVNMEPNGGSFVLKIRQIASTLLDTPRNRKGPLALKADEYLAQFLDVLMKLERVSPPGKRDHMNFGFAAKNYRNADEEDEDELRTWADLREFQTRFAASGGFLTAF